MKNILCRKDRITLLAKYGNPKPHRHFSKHILISTAPFLCRTSEKSLSVRSAFIQSGEWHCIRRTEDIPMLVCLIDETSDLSRIIDDSCLRGRGVCELPPDLEETVKQMLRQEADLCRIDRFLEQKLIEQRKNDRRPDPRIEEAIRLIEGSESIDSGVYDRIPAALFLSKSRFLHLFKEEIGMDFKNYLLLKKLEKTFYYVAERKITITQAALLAGFSGSSHFSTACMKHYGMSLTGFLKEQNEK